LKHACISLDEGVYDMRVFFLKKDVIIWGIVLLIAVIVLIVVFRVKAGEAETMKQGLVSIMKGG
jgi:t-SNARE complex subunit (syntaxin)